MYPAIELTTKLSEHASGLRAANNQTSRTQAHSIVALAPELVITVPSSVVLFLSLVLLARFHCCGGELQCEYLD